MLLGKISTKNLRLQAIFTDNLINPAQVWSLATGAFHTGNTGVLVTSWMVFSEISPRMDENWEISLATRKLPDESCLRPNLWQTVYLRESYHCVYVMQCHPWISWPLGVHNSGGSILIANYCISNYYVWGSPTQNWEHLSKIMGLNIQVIC